MLVIFISQIITKMATGLSEDKMVIFKTEFYSTITFQHFSTFQFQNEIGLDANQTEGKQYLNGCWADSNDT